MELLIKNLALEAEGHLSLNEPFVSLDNETRADGLRKFNEKLKSGEYRMEPHPCVCGSGDDVLVAEIDRYGIPLNTVLCKRCGLMRSDPFYTQETLNGFYQNEYRAIYTGEGQSTEAFFQKQMVAGEHILGYLRPWLPEDAVVYEVGAGAGGILKAFNQAGHTTRGCDLGGEYIRYGQAQGVDLHEGDYTTLLPYEKADLLILNHVLEHITDPVSFLTGVQSFLKPDALVFIGVPGLVYYPVNYRSKLLFYLQNAHSHHYCLQTLQFVAARTGLSLVFGDETVTSLFRRGAVEVAPLPSTSGFLIGLIEKAQRLADLQQTQQRKNRELSAQVGEDKIALRRVRGALKRVRSQVDDQKQMIKRNKREIQDQAAQMAKVQSDLAKKRKEISEIKRSYGWKLICFWRKLLKVSGVSSAFNLLVKKPVLYVAKKRHWHLLFRKLKVRESVIFFESHRGLSYSDSPKAICEAILARGLPVKCVWSFHDPSQVEVPAAVEKVKRFSVTYYYHHACARILIQNGEFAQGLPIRKEQLYINTQHGTPLKLMGIDILHKKPGIDLGSYSKNGRWGYLVSPNRYTTEIFKRAFVYDGPVLESGYPRNDLFYRKNNPDDIAAVKAGHGLPSDKKVLLYAPTWRDLGGSRIDRGFQLQLDLDDLRREFGETHVIILRLHHLIVSALKINPEHEGFVFDFSSGRYDIQELMLVTDVLITDYSSVMFDYSNLCRPIVFFAYDLAEYSSDIRGTYFDLKEEAPGPVVETMEDLVVAIRDTAVWEEEYATRQKAFHEKFCSLENGTASDQVIDKIIKPAINLE